MKLKHKRTGGDCPCGCTAEDNFCVQVLTCCGTGDPAATVSSDDGIPLPTDPSGLACFSLDDGGHAFHVEAANFERDVEAGVPATPSPLEISHPGCACATDHWGTGDLTVATPFGDLVLSYIGPHWAACQTIACDGYPIHPPGHDLAGLPAVDSCNDLPVPIAVEILYELRCLGPLEYPGGRVAYPCGRLEMSISYYSACGPNNDRTPLEVPCGTDFYPVGFHFQKTKFSTIDVGLLDCRVSPSLEWHFDFSVFGGLADDTVRLGDTPWISATGNYSVLPEPAEVCVVVRTCPEPDGIPVVGADISIADGTPSSGNTDSEGRFCATVDQAGPALVIVSKDGCFDSFWVEVPVCDSPEEAVFILCCAKVCLVLYEDGTDPPEPIADAEVNLGPLGVYHTDEDGVVCVELTAAQIDLLAPGPTCIDRAIEDVRIKRNATETETALLERCEIDLEVSCGEDQTAAPQEVFAAFIPPGYQRGSCCPDDGCGSIGPPGRNLAPEQPDLALEIVRVGGGGPWYGTFRFDGPIAIDLDALDADGVTTYESGCVAPSIAPTYQIPGPGEIPIDVPFESCVVRIELCREGGLPGRVRARVFRDADCPGFVDWESPPDGNDIDFDFDLSAGKVRACYGEPLDDAGTIPGGDNTYEISVTGP